ncbi:MAG: hypothetical protein H6810_04810 [Phycisphaeraceae bacterium]|nr:MAG: hypothetical protein H6810_04810 [Phycisphaeraceae bacterium]
MPNRSASLVIITLLVAALLTGRSVGQCDALPPEMSVELGWTNGPQYFHYPYNFQTIHKTDVGPAQVVALDTGWTELRPTVNDNGDALPLRARLDTVSLSAVQRRVRLTVESESGPFPWEAGAFSCGNGGGVVAPGGYIAGVRLQRVGTPHADESRKFDLPGATQLRSIKSRIYQGSQEVLIGTDSDDLLTTYTNVGLSQFFLSDGYATPNGDVKVFYNPNDLSDAGYPGYRLVGTPDDATVNPADPGDPNYSGVVLHLFDACDYDNIDRFEIDFVFDLAATGDQNGDHFLDEGEYTSLFGAMPAAGSESGAGSSPSLFDGLTAQTDLHPLAVSTPNDGDGFDPYLAADELQDRDDFYRTAEGFLNTMAETYLDRVLKPLLEETFQVSRLRLLEFEETRELIRYQSIFVENTTYLEIDFGDGGPTMKMRYVESYEAVEIWYERRTTTTTQYIYEVDNIPVSDVVGPELHFWVNQATEICGWIGKGLGIYNIIVGYCDFLNEWKEVYNPYDGISGDFCENGCVNFYSYFTEATGILSESFGTWGGLILIVSPAYCFNTCSDLHEPAYPDNVRFRRLEGAYDFLLTQRNNCYTGG